MKQLSNSCVLRIFLILSVLVLAEDILICFSISCIYFSNRLFICDGSVGRVGGESSM